MNVVSSSKSNILRTSGCKLSEFNIAFNTRKIQFISSRHRVIFFALYRQFGRLHKKLEKARKYDTLVSYVVSFEISIGVLYGKALV